MLNLIRTNSSPSQSPQLCNCEGLKYSSKGRIIDMVCWNLHQAYLLRMGLVQIPTDHETMFIVYHVRVHVDSSSTIIFLSPWAFTFWCEVNLDGLGLYD